MSSDSARDFPDAFESSIVISGVPVITHLAGNNSPRTAVIHAGGRHSVFTVVITLLRGQQAFTISEWDTVSRIGKRSAAMDQLQGLARFGWQFYDMNFRYCARLTTRPESLSKPWQ
jgi:hypothetical protein